MSRLYSHINTARTILSRYKGDVPFAVFIKGFFAKGKKYGSKDRKSISALCYNYFRTGNAYADRPFEEKLLLGVFLCSIVPNEYLEERNASWHALTKASVEEKIDAAGVEGGSIFPFSSELSEEIDKNAFARSFISQPKLFIRVRPGQMPVATSKLLRVGIGYEKLDDQCLAFDNGTKLDDVLLINKEAVIQDYNSQQTGELITTGKIGKGAAVWDCCAASGGKSILAFDYLPHIKLTVSDVRVSIIRNLQIRFKEAGIRDYDAFVLDLANVAQQQSSLSGRSFDLIICDAPCSGSGTWGRTPEQLLYFHDQKIQHYQHLQKKIVDESIKYIKKGGYFLYITCSVFKKENEDVVNHVLDCCSLSLVQHKYYKGYNIQADTLFAALFIAD